MSLAPVSCHYHKTSSELYVPSPERDISAAARLPGRFFQKGAGEAFSRVIDEYYGGRMDSRTLELPGAGHRRRPDIGERLPPH
ncbi:MAG: hypothetical protein K6D94_03775 [Clostridiales bacterium]|nr:hypothetical protein [Clostridiales bacterium]